MSTEGDYQLFSDYHCYSEFWERKELLSYISTAVQIPGFCLACATCTRLYWQTGYRQVQVSSTYVFTGVPTCTPHTHVQQGSKYLYYHSSHPVLAHSKCHSLQNWKSAFPVMTKDEVWTALTLVWKRRGLQHNTKGWLCERAWGTRGSGALNQFAHFCCWRSDEAGLTCPRCGPWLFPAHHLSPFLSPQISAGNLCCKPGSPGHCCSPTLHTHMSESIAFVFPGPHPRLEQVRTKIHLHFHSQTALM